MYVMYVCHVCMPCTQTKKELIVPGLNARYEYVIKNSLFSRTAKLNILHCISSC